MALQNISFRNLSCWFDYVSVRKNVLLTYFKLFSSYNPSLYSFPNFSLKNLSLEFVLPTLMDILLSTHRPSQLMLDFSANLLLIDLIVYSKSCKTSLLTNSSNVFTNKFHEFFPRIFLSVSCWKMVFFFTKIVLIYCEKKLF